MVRRSIEVNDEINTVDVDASRCHISSDENCRIFSLELSKCASAYGLRLSAMKGSNLHTSASKIPRQTICAMLGAHEEDRLPIARCDLIRDISLVRLAHHQDIVI